MTERLTIQDLATGLSRRGMPLPVESGLFIILEAVEAMGARSLWLTPAGVQVGVDGMVTLAPDLDEVSPLESMMSALDTLEAVLPTPSPGAVALTGRVRSGDVATVAVFTSELSALLVPLNRAAARRMVGRLVREYAREHGAAATPVQAVVRDEATVDDAAPRGGAQRTRSEGEGRATDTEPDADTRDDWDAPSPRRTAAGGRGAGVAVLLLAVVAILAAGVFLYHRLQHAEARGSGTGGLHPGVVAAVRTVG